MASPASKRMANPREELVDRWVHGLGVAAGLIGFLVLMRLAPAQGSLAHVASLAVYGLALFAMLTCSALYNIARGTRHGETLRRIDHAAIFVMIAATYTPFLTVKIGGAWGHGLLAFVWAVAAGGAAMKLLRPRRFERSALIVYLALGWTVLATLGPLTAAVSAACLALLLGGGILYTVGVLFHLWDSLPYQRAIWHGFVLAAATCHYAAILSDVALPGLRA